jgi:polyisoprenoid-binding protein YceI
MPTEHDEDLTHVLALSHERARRRGVQWAHVTKTLPTLLLVAIVAVACGGAAAPEPAATATATPAATTAPATTSPAPAAQGGVRFEATSGEVTVAVREQLADRPAPNDAVLTTSGVSGTFTLGDDGTFTDDSRIEVALSGLRSDSGIRDGFVKENTLQTDRFPTATFVPTRAEGLTLPLADGAFAFKLVGDMTVSGVTKEVTWEVTGERSGDRITATAMNAPAWKFGDFGLEIPRVFSVLSIVDEIRLEVKLEATAR